MEVLAILSRRYATSNAAESRQKSTAVTSAPRYRSTIAQREIARNRILRSGLFLTLPDTSPTRQQTFKTDRIMGDGQSFIELGILVYDLGGRCGIVVPPCDPADRAGDLL
jgi:hypothetical protein